jgi:hypothetical protein
MIEAAAKTRTTALQPASGHLGMPGSWGGDGSTRADRVGQRSAIKGHSPFPLDGRSDVGSGLQTVLGLCDTNAGIVHRHRLSTARITGDWQTPDASPRSFALIS